MILNLVDQSISDVRYTISKFPDGQQSFIINGPSGIHNFVIVSRMNSFNDLELIICATQSLREMKVKDISLYSPYCLGGRSDRKFTYGGTNYIKNVLAPIINSQNYKEVSILDPHSDVLEACINNFNGIDNISLVHFALSNINDKPNLNKRTLIISPDSGALKKIYKVAKFFEIENVVTASKVRDILSGEIIRTELPKMDLNGIDHIMIIDDIGDGFGTFIGLSKEIKKQTDKPIYLVVTHSIQEKGILNALNNFDKIFTTNSIYDWKFDNLFVFNVFNSLYK